MSTASLTPNGVATPAHGFHAVETGRHHVEHPGAVTVAELRKRMSTTRSALPGGRHRGIAARFAAAIGGAR